MNNAPQNLKFFTAVLDREPEKKWQQIKWRTPQEAIQLSKVHGKPLFMEIVVGRLRNSSSAVC